ncbi:MAG TPA: hypothetical protein DDY91_06875 [Planctomycetaceae bacterium]|nr:hypothetical protein [Planctomycetaceae bacterium]
MTGPPPSKVELFRECLARGLRLGRTGPQGMDVSGPREVLSPSLLERLKEHKADLLDLLQLVEERAALMEFDGGLTRSEADQRALAVYFTQRTA